MIFNSICFQIFSIPAYLFCSCVGFTISVSMFILLLSKKGYSIKVNIRILGISIINLIIFAKIFGCFSGIYRAVGTQENVTLKTITNTGIVFYGGLFGLLSMYSLCLKKTNADKTVLNILAVIIPLFHSIARIGCFLAGCCFGIKNPIILGIKYVTRIGGTIDVAYRLPIQLIEAIFNFFLFFYLFCLLREKNWKTQDILYKYLLIYSIGRFFLEFFRGDIVRGIIKRISFSQVISIFIWLFLLYKRKNK